MWRLAFYVGVAMLLGALSAPAGAAETGTIEGRVLNETTGLPQADVDVRLTSANDTGSERFERIDTTDADGRYEFARLPTGDDRFYALDVRFEGGLFPSGAISIPSDTSRPPIIETQIRVWSTTTDPDPIVIERDNMFVVPSDGDVGIVESVRVANLSDRAYIGRGGSEDGDERAIPSLGFSLPPGAEEEGVAIVDSDLDVPELMRTSFGFAITTAIPPGTTNMTFSYSVSGTAGSYDLSRRALYPILDLSVYTADPLDLTAPRLSSKGSVDIDDKTYERYATDETLDAGDSVQMLALADAGASPGLLLGMAGALVLVLALGLFPVWQMRRSRAGEDENGVVPQEPRSREDVIREIAELDLRHQRGELAEADWAARRSELKGEIHDEGDGRRS
ncbi:MAG: carboxypeptidase-like regulatory domain-containing protein [Actinomycetota bacterium]